MIARPHANARTALRPRRRRADPMAEFDRLPPEPRRWLAGAVLPWSPRSVRRAWAEALARTGGDRAGALRLLDERERRRLASDAPTIWGSDHPGLTEPHDAGDASSVTDWAAPGAHMPRRGPRAGGASGLSPR